MTTLFFVNAMVLSLYALSTSQTNIRDLFLYNIKPRATPPKLQAKMVVLRRTHKRKLVEMAAEDDERENTIFGLNEVNQDLLEIILSWLPTSSFFQLSSVCKRWKSVADSETFRIACSRVPEREPWFYMVDSRPKTDQHPAIFDSSENNWKKLDPLSLKRLKQNHNLCSDFIPVATSGGLICFHGAYGGDFVVSNPVTGTCRLLNPFSPSPEQAYRAIALKSNAESFKLVIISGEMPNLTFREYNSMADEWGRETALTRKSDTWPWSEADADEDCTHYFLNKCGNVVSTDIQRNPSKKYSSILTIEGQEEILYFLSSSGSVVACNLTTRFFFSYPVLLPAFSEYSIDLVECSGKMHVVLQSEFLETASLGVWAWDENAQFWRRVAAMPPWMSHGFSGKKVDINCAGAGRRILVCASSSEICGYFLCDLDANEWVELPDFDRDEEDRREFVCAFSLEPRIEASVWGRRE